MSAVEGAFSHNGLYGRAQAGQVRTHGQTKLSAAAQARHGVRARRRASSRRSRNLRGPTADEIAWRHHAAPHRRTRGPHSMIGRRGPGGILEPLGGRPVRSPRCHWRRYTDTLSARPLAHARQTARRENRETGSFLDPLNRSCAAEGRADFGHRTVANRLAAAKISGLRQNHRPRKARTNLGLSHPRAQYRERRITSRTRALRKSCARRA